VIWTSSGLRAVLADRSGDAGGLILEVGLGDGAERDLHDLVASRGHIAHMHRAVGKAHVERDPATAFAVGVDQGIERRVDAGLPQGMGKGAALPFLVEAVLHVLGRAAAALVEIGAERRFALGRGGLDRDKVGPRCVPLDRDGFARQGLGYEDGPGLAVRDPVGLRAEACDRHLFSHGVLPAEILDCRPHPRWARGRAPGA
jgi:hypothetical protein